MHPDEYKLVRGKKLLRRADDGRRVIVATRDGIGVIVIFKAASRSMIAAKTKQLAVGRDELPDELHVFVREPIERLRSAYQFFVRRPPAGEPNDNMSWEEFIDRVLDGAKNVHWRPVTEVLATVNRDDVIVHLFENLESEFPWGNLQRRNVAKVEYDVDMTYRADELRTMYAGDYALRGI